MLRAMALENAILDKREYVEEFKTKLEKVSANPIALSSIELPVRTLVLGLSEQMILEPECSVKSVRSLLESVSARLKIFDDLGKMISRSTGEAVENSKTPHLSTDKCLELIYADLQAVTNGTIVEPPSFREFRKTILR